jgi:hypothetical protein
MKGFTGEKKGNLIYSATYLNFLSVLYQNPTYNATYLNFLNVLDQNPIP